MTLETADYGAFSAISQTDEALIAEIAPPMLAKLRRDGRSQLIWISCATILAANLLMSGKGLIFGETFNVFFVGLGVACLIVGIAGLCVLRRYGDLMVKAEVNYRRKHGKWRWDR